MARKPSKKRPPRAGVRLPPPRDPVPSDDDPKTRSTFVLRTSTHTRLKVAAATRGVEMSRLVEDSILSYLDQAE